jgi:hypothetical protein
MPVEYYIRIKSPTGEDLAYVDDFLDLSYSKRLWEPGLLQFMLDGNSPKISLLSDNSIIEVYRRKREDGIDWYCDFWGLYRKQIRNTPQDVDYFQAHCPGGMTMLGWSIVGYADKTNNRSKFTAQPVETVMKNLVKYNLTTALATTGNGRYVTLSWTNPVITVETDASRGTSIDWKCPNKTVLGELQAIAKVAGGDFDLVYVSGNTWDFRYYPNQLGTNRTASVLFTTESGSMANPEYILDKINEATVAIVGGRGDAANRTFKVVTGPTYNASTNAIETFVQAADQDSDAYLTSKGNEVLYQAQARNTFKFKVMQVPSLLYGRDYFLGDLVKARYKSIEFTQKVFGVSVRYPNSGKEEINIELKDA